MRGPPGRGARRLARAGGRNESLRGTWLGGRDSNPDKQIQSLSCYRYTTSQQKGRTFLSIGGADKARKTAAARYGLPL